MIRTIRPSQVQAALAKTDKAARKGLKRGVLEAAALGTELAARQAPVDTGKLKQSFRLRRKGASGHPEIVADAPYAGIVEAGARPHWTPMLPLVRWVRRHAKSFGIAEGQKRSKGKGSAFGAGPEIVAVARAIQRKIGYHGQKPKWVVRGLMPKLRVILKDCVAGQTKRAMMEAASQVGGAGGTP